MPLMLWRSFRRLSTLPTKLLTCTTLLNPLVMAIPWVLFRGKPEPLQVTLEPESAQPAIFKLAASTGTPASCRSEIASGMLSAQSPENPPAQGTLLAMWTIEGLVTPPNELPTL